MLIRRSKQERKTNFGLVLHLIDNNIHFWKHNGICTLSLSEKSRHIQIKFSQKRFWIKDVKKGIQPNDIKDLKFALQTNTAWPENLFLYNTFGQRKLCSGCNGLCKGKIWSLWYWTDTKIDNGVCLGFHYFSYFALTKDCRYSFDPHQTLCLYR